MVRLELIKSVPVLDATKEILKITDGYEVVGGFRRVNFIDWSFLEYFYIDPDLQLDNKGYGGKAIDFYNQWLKDSNKNGLLINAICEPGIPKVHDMYQRRGWIASFGNWEYFPVSVHKRLDIKRIINWTDKHLISWLRPEDGLADLIPRVRHHRRRQLS